MQQWLPASLAGPATQVRTPPVAVPTDGGISDKVQNVIQTEVRRLEKAAAVLTSLQEAPEHEIDVDLADVADVVCDLLGTTLLELDRAGVRSEPEPPREVDR